MKRWVQVRRSQYGGWMMGCDRCPGAWDYGTWRDAVRDAHWHAGWHVEHGTTR